MSHGFVLAALSFAGVLTDAGRSLREGAYMFWDTLWALVLGFSLSGAIQAFVSREQMRRQLGDHRPAAIARASLFGMISSSCSYAASAMARSLFARGADFVAAMVFMVASTNLVVELGLVLLVLIGWQFLVAEFVGGVVMIVFLVVAGSLWFRGRALDEARRQVEVDGDRARDHDAGTPQTDGQPFDRRARSLAGWADAASYTMSDLQMLRKELVIGFGVAGFLATLVSPSVWNDLFLHGHGFWTSLENVVVGPFVALISFVCSIGNIPLAAALWKGGITFGGVVSFVFADLITLPLLLIYRKQYGARMTLRLLAVFWTVMSAAGLATEYLFRAVGWIPRQRSQIVAGNAFRVDYTTILDIVALVVFGVLYVLYRNRERCGGSGAYAKDPVCGMQVEIANAPASRSHGGTTISFCSEHCAERFDQSPDRYVSAAPPPRQEDRQRGHVTDPICGMVIAPEDAAAHRVVAHQLYYFCGVSCADAFDRKREGEAISP